MRQEQVGQLSSIPHGATLADSRRDELRLPVLGLHLHPDLQLSFRPDGLRGTHRNSSNHHNTTHYHRPYRAYP